MLNQFFSLSQRRTTYRIESVAGLTTFLYHHGHDCPELQHQHGSGLRFCLLCGHQNRFGQGVSGQTSHVGDFGSLPDLSSIGQARASYFRLAHPNQSRIKPRTSY